MAGTHCAYPQRDGQAELTWVTAYIPYLSTVALLAGRYGDHMSTALTVFLRLGKLWKTTTTSLTGLTRKRPIKQPRVTVTGYGFVDFETAHAAELAVKALQANGIQAQMAKVRIILCALSRLGCLASLLSNQNVDFGLMPLRCLLTL